LQIEHFLHFYFIKSGLFEKIFVTLHAFCAKVLVRMGVRTKTKHNLQLEKSNNKHNAIIN